MKVTATFHGADNLLVFVPVPESRHAAKQTIQEIQELIKSGKDKFTVTVEPHRNRRSLDANSYLWVLIQEIANVLKADRHTVYIDMLKDYGQREEQLISVIKEGYQAIERATEKHCHIVGEAELKGKEFYHVALLRGSSTYDTKEMSILTDGVISEAKDLGIETATPEERTRMLSEWKK